MSTRWPIAPPMAAKRIPDRAPALIARRQALVEVASRCGLILALYSRGLSTRDIEAYLAEIYGVSAGEEQAKLTLADYFDIHLDRAPKEGAELVLDPIVLVARSISGGRVNVVGLRLPEDEEKAVPLTRRQAFRRKLAEVWSSVAGV